MLSDYTTLLFAFSSTFPTPFSFANFVIVVLMVL